MKQKITFLLVVCLLISLVQPVSASSVNENYVSPRYTYISRCSSGLSINESTGVATCRASCNTSAGYTVQVECKLQRYMGSYWGTIKTWTDTDTQAVLITKNWAVYSGYTYRVHTTFSVFNSAGVLLESDVITDTYSFY